MSSHSSLIMLLSKLASQSLRSLASAPEIEMYPCHRNLATVFAVWSRVTYAITCLMKWSLKTITFTMYGGLSSSIVISMLVKSTWSSSKGEVTRIACRGAFTQAPSYWIHLSQLLITFCICTAMPGHKNWSCNRDNIHHRPWCPVSLWQPLMAATLWAIGTTNCRTFSSSLAGVWQWQRAPWWSVNFFLSLLGWPCSLLMWCGLPGDVWDPVLYGRKSTPSQF